MRGAHGQRGSAMIEFTVVAPVLTLIGLSILQYGMLFFAKDQINHATFMAARAGSMGNARIETIQRAYAEALVPLYGGGRDSAELQQARVRALADVVAFSQVRIVSPTRESFDDWNDAALERKYRARAYSNAHLESKDPDDVRSASGQNIHDANVLKVKLTHGYEPKMPLVGKIYTQYLRDADPGTDAFYTLLVNAGRIPVVSQVTVQMQSDPIETASVTTPGETPEAEPSGPGEPPAPGQPPGCTTGDCPAEPPPAPSDPGGGTTDPPGGTPPPVTCPGQGSTTSQSLPADLLFAFNSSTLTTEGKAYLDTAITQLQGQTFDSIDLIGYTDQLGSDSVNKALSLARAAATRDYIAAHGLPDAVISVKGMGSSLPKVELSACPGGGAAQIACLAPNRRVDVVVNGLR